MSNYEKDDIGKEDFDKENEDISKNFLVDSDDIKSDLPKIDENKVDAFGFDEAEMTEIPPIKQDTARGSDTHYIIDEDESEQLSLDKYIDDEANALAEVAAIALISMGGKKPKKEKPAKQPKVKKEKPPKPEKVSKKAKSNKKDDKNGLTESESQQPSDNVVSVEIVPESDAKGKKKAKMASNPKKKKILIICVTVAILIVMITLAIVLPIVIINKDKIFISKPSDFAKTKGHTYVLNKNVEVSGNLEIGNFSIDLNKKQLTVKGDLIIDLTAATESNIYIGTKDGKTFEKSGSLVVEGSFTIKGNATSAVSIHAPLSVSGNLSVSANSFVAGNQITATASVFNCKEAVLNGEINGFSAQNGTFYLNANSLSDVVLFATKMYAGASIELDKVYLDDASEFYTKSKAKLISGKVDADGNLISKGKLVYLDEGSDTAAIKNISVVKVYSGHCTFGSIIAPDQLVTIQKLSTPSRLTTETVGNQIFVIATPVKFASKYTFFVDDNEVATVDTNRFDMTKYLSEKGEHKIKVIAKGTTSNTAEFIDSEPVYATFTYAQKLATPSSIQIVEKEGKFFLEFKPVSFADKYVVDINGTKMTLANVAGVDKQSFDVTAIVKKAGSYSIMVIAKSENETNFQDSEKGLGQFAREITLGVAQLDASIDANSNLQLSWKAVVNARYYEIYKKSADGSISLVELTPNLNLTLTNDKLANGDTFYVVAQGYDYYLTSVNSNEKVVTVTVSEAGKVVTVA